MNTLNFLDSNVWLALLWSRHSHADQARVWFQQSSEEQFFFCRFTQLTVLRLLTTKQIMGRDTQTMADAWRLWDTIWADTRVAYLAEPEGLEVEFRIHSRLKMSTPKVWGDAYLLAFATTADLRLVTFDKALESRAPNVLVL